MKTFLKWVGRAFALVPAALVLYLLEFLIQYMWLGRDLPIGRMWVNLIIVSLLIGAGFVGLVYFLVYFFEAEPIFWYWISMMVLFFALGPAINAVCSNPAIGWGTGQQFAYGAGLVVMIGFYLRWALKQMPPLISD